MGPPSYMRSVVDRNVVMRCKPVFVELRGSEGHILSDNALKGCIKLFLICSKCYFRHVSPCARPSSVKSFTYDIAGQSWL